MKQLFDDLSAKVSKITTQKYSTSFSLGILALSSSIRPDIYSIYGFVRLADEIVDSFHEYNKPELLQRFVDQTWDAIDEKISLNPILNSFQAVVHKHQIDHSLIQQFLKSMKMDLEQVSHDTESIKEYIVGSAEVVGLMCLHVFAKGDKNLYAQLEPYAMKLGSAFQKVNFLRDLKDDYQLLGRTYFPHLDMSNFTDEVKREIEKDIHLEFSEALEGIKMLPLSARFGVFLAYRYYLSLFSKITKVKASNIMQQRIRIPNGQKLSLAMRSFITYKTSL